MKKRYMIPEATAVATQPTAIICQSNGGNVINPGGDNNPAGIKANNFWDVDWSKTDEDEDAGPQT